MELDSQEDPGEIKEKTGGAGLSNVKEVGTPPVPIKQLVYSANCCFNGCAEQSRKDSVRDLSSHSS